MDKPKPGRGGPRANSGGARPGAGRPKKQIVLAEGDDPLAFLLQVMQGHIDPSPSQLKAAIAAAAYVHKKKAEGGKKEQAQERAEETAQGKFAPSRPPLRAVNA